MRMLAAAFATLSLGLAGCTGTWGGGGDAEGGGGDCDPACVSRCRQECTHSADSGGYDDCAAGCTCGCD